MKENITKIFILLNILVYANILSYSQNKGLIYGFVHDRITHENLFGTRVSLLKNDSVIAIWETNEQSHFNNNKGPWIFDTDLKAGKYTILFERSGYNTFYFPLLEKPLKAGEIRFIADVFLDKTPQKHIIDGVIIKATKVKFHNKGDTIIYNADAFQTANGSMLDALIKQLPGVELDEIGQIFVNGRKIESLILNGEKFFNGKNQVILENLPAFMVKSIKTYEKLGLHSQIAGKDMGDKEFVMDVILKKEYQLGCITNTEIGIGTEKRYLSRLFAMSFTHNSRIALYGNINNLNDTKKPDRNSLWTPETMPSGLLAAKKSGIDFFTKSKNDRSTYNANIELESHTLDNRTITSSETFMPMGNIYTRYHNTNASRNFTLTTSHYFKTWSPNKGYSIILKPELTYNRYDNYNNINSITFNQDLDINNLSSYTDSVNQEGNNMIYTHINQIIHYNKPCGQSLYSKLSYQFFKNIGPVNYIGIEGNVLYRRQTKQLKDYKKIIYPNQSVTTNNTIYRHTTDKPNKEFQSMTSIFYQQQFGKHLSTILMYTITHISNNKEHLTFLNEKTNTNNSNPYTLDILPSEKDFILTTDTQNSYWQTLHNVINTPSITLKYNKQTLEQNPAKRLHKINRITSELCIPLNFFHEKLDYTQHTYNDITKRNRIAFNPYLSFEILSNDFRDKFSFHYGLQQTAPPINYTIDILNNEDPLNLYYGNILLKNTSSHNVKLNWSSQNSKKHTQNNFTLHYNISHNAIVMSYIYDKKTGTHTYRPENVNGNYKVSSSYYFLRPLLKSNNLIFDSNIYGHIIHGIDLASNSSQQKPLRNSIMTYWITERTNIKYKLNQHITIGAKGYLGYGHSKSGKYNINSVSICNYHYGLTALINLPQEWQFNTDIIMYSQQRYSEINKTNSLVWNARLSKSFTKSGIIFTLDGFDILKKLSNISHTLNSQGKTEVWNNSLPRYIMAHIIYRFNRQPKKTTAAK